VKYKKSLANRDQDIKKIQDDKNKVEDQVSNFNLVFPIFMWWIFLYLSNWVYENLSSMLLQIILCWILGYLSNLKMKLL